VGLEDDDALLQIATAPDRRCEIAYYLGLRAWSERRYEDASDWFRVVLETGQRREGEYVWAMDALDGWAGTRRRLREAAERSSL
jgi:hypothetical protein